MSNETIGFSPDAFNAWMDFIGGGKRLPYFPIMPEPKSTLPSALEPFKILDDMHSILEIYHEFLKDDTETSKKVGEEFVTLDKYLVLNIQNNS